MRLLPFYSTSRDNRRQLQLARNLHIVVTRRPTGRSRHHPYHIHSFRGHQRPRYHPKYLRTLPRGASRLRRRLSPHLLISRARPGLGNGHACQAPSIHTPTLLITHNNTHNSAQADDRAQIAPVTLTHTIPFHHLRLQKGNSRQRQMVNCQDVNQSFRLGRSLHSENNIDIVSRVGSLSRHEHIIAERVIRYVPVLYLSVVDKRAHEGRRRCLSVC